MAISRDARGHYFASFVYAAPEAEERTGEVVAFDLGLKTLAVGVNEHGRVYAIGGMKGTRWYNRQLDKLDAKRVYRCSNPDCLLVLDRDENSARNILQRYFARPGPHIQCSWMRCAAVDQCGVAVTATAQAGQAQQ